MHLRQDKHCRVVVNGKVLTGPCCVWRAPTQGPLDIEAGQILARCAQQIVPQVWRAVPVDKKLKEDNCIVVSGLGDCNSNMAGGDFDGDLNMVSFHEDLIKLIEMTADSVDKAKWSDREEAKLRKKYM